MSARERLEALDRERAARFDPEGVRFIERLVEAGLEARAEGRLDKLASELAEARREAEAIAKQIADAGGTLDPVLVSALEEGDYRHARRLAKRMLVELDTSRGSATESWARGVAARARTRAIRLSPDLAFRVEALERRPESTAGRREAHALGIALSRALFEESRASTRATVALARAADHVPESAGPYNTRALAAQALGALATLSPSYLSGYVAMLDDLAALDRLDAPPPKSKPFGRRRR